MQLHQLALTLLAVALPVILITLPKVQLSMNTIAGTYDVFLIAALLPKAQVRALLPDSTFGAGSDPLLPVPDAYLRALIPGNEGVDDERSKGHHLVLLQMGYQMKTGPGPSWMPKLSFSECKLEVPFIKHPLATSSPTTSGTGMGFDELLVYKQNIIVSNPLVRTSCGFIGLTAAGTQFEPAGSPSIFPAGAAELAYKAQGLADARASQPAHPLSSAVAEASWHFYQELANAWWFGTSTGKTVQKFTFDVDAAPIKPEAYEVTVDIDLRAFAPVDKKSDIALPTGNTTLHGLGWRLRAPFASHFAKPGQFTQA